MIKKVRSFPRQIMHCLLVALALSSFYGCGAAGRGGVSPSSTTAQGFQSVSVTVAPLAAEIRAGDTQQFSAIVSGTVQVPVGAAPPASATPMDRLLPFPNPIRSRPATQGVVWSINGVPGGNAAMGTISAQGLYTSPAVLPTLNAIEVNAASAAEPSVSETALLTLYNPIPAVTKVTPAKVPVGTFSLTISGRGFVPGAQVLFAGIPLETTFSTSTKLIATGAATQAQVGSAQVLVTNPEPGSAKSAALIVQVAAAPPTSTQPVAAPSTTWNPAVLGVPWASDFTSIASNQINVKTDSRLKIRAIGDGATDDTAAVRAAIQLASSSGGGVVYFPVGDYKIITPSSSSRGNPLAGAFTGHFARRQFDHVANLCE